MNRNSRRSSNKKVEKNSKQIIRCKLKMRVIFDNDNCEDFLKKDSSIPNKVCRNCKHSF